MNLDEAMDNMNEIVFKKESEWQSYYSILPRVCHYSNRIIWPFSRAYVKISTRRFLKNQPKEYTWVHHDEFVIRRLKGEI